MTKRFGFTLAEVLITLGIIGVVAAMTIPTLMNSTNDAQFKTGFKKIISTLSQAITMNVATNNADFSTLTAGACTTTGTVCNMFTSLMNVAKTGNAADTTLDTTSFLMANGTNNYVIYFNDGMVLSFPTGAATCNNPIPAAACKAVVDINGGKGPNRLTNCLATDPATTNSAPVDTTACTSTNTHYHDRFGIKFVNQQVLPNGQGAAATLYN